MSCDPHGDRTRCTDPVPVCPNVCDRPNPVCGHPCPAKCHAGDCPPCKLTTTITCRCGRSTKEVTCSEFADQKASSGVLKMTCERICKKKKTCGRHKCKNQCCDMVIHACMEICGRTLSCGKHTCEDPCHCGPCGSCWRGVIYEEVHCYCGYTVLPPPQPCGTKPPECDQPCTREHPCDHPVRHTCHSGPECPPCTELLTKPCPGGHTFLYNVPCFQIVATCGRVCDKPLPGCAHKCQRICHAGDCLVPTSGGPRDAVDHCTQPCLRPRPECGHACAVPCHDAQGLTCVQAIAKSAPKCRALIDLVCLCGRHQESQPCYQVRNLARQLEKKDPTIFLRAQNTAVGESGLPFGLTSNAILPCDSSCAKQAKAEKATTADTGDGTSRPWALGPEKPGEAAGVKCPSHRFPPMNKQKRRFIKELAEFYGVETVAFDPEPHRHLLAMTTRATACFPGGSRQHYTSLSSQMHKQFTGSVKVTGVGSSLSNRLAPVRSNVEAVLKPVSFSVATASSSSANPSQDT
ncbi:Transcriptional repressor NF-X1 [Sparganum proliferum]